MSDETTELIDEEPVITAPGEFEVVLIDESKPTIDGRIFEPGVVTWREPPIPLMFMTQNGDNGHKGSIAGGVITEVWRDGDHILGKGRFDSGENGQELQRLITEQVLTGISSDVGGAIVEQELAEDGSAQARIIQGRIMGATVLPFQAFDDTRIAVTASAVPTAPPKEWFGDPKLQEPTALTITKDGQVFGHAALWETCHIGKPGQCLTPPRSKSGYAYFRTGAVLTADGDQVATGPITLGTGHANVTLNGNAAAEHYDHTGTAIADVATGEDSHGIWMAGAVRPSATDDRLHELRAATISGDWRGIKGSHELVALLAVNTPGFPVPRTRATFAEERPLALVAAGMLTPDEELTTMNDELESLTADSEPVVAGGVIELFNDVKDGAGAMGKTDKKHNADEDAGEPNGDPGAEEAAVDELSDEERLELTARLDALELAVVSLAARSLDFNVGDGQKCPKCGGTVAAGRDTCHNCGAKV